MEEQKDILGMLDIMVVPAFYAENKTVRYVNAPGKGLLIEPGTPVRDLLLTGLEEYDTFSGGCLYLTMRIGGVSRGACVNKVGSADVFVLDQASGDGPLTALALAARELRQPLSNVMLTAGKLSTPENREDSARLNRSIHQMLRILGNMADAGSFVSGARMETVNITATMGEILEKAREMLAHTGISLECSLPQESIYSQVDPLQLERAVLNILSNALKFTAPGGWIRVSLVRKGRMLQLSIQDSGSGITAELLPTVFTRYLRAPAVEDGRHGIGLGMVLIRSAASHHGGAVLIDTPQEGGTRITMTLEIRQGRTALHSPVLLADYSGGWDHTLVELSQSLPPELYTQL